jgi:similar to stage IV sporulation protein
MEIIFSLFAFLFGSCRIVLPKNSILFSAFIKKQMGIGIFHTEDDRLVLETLLISKRKIFRELNRIGIQPISVQVKGLPTKLFPYLHRPGIFIGILAFLSILYFSSLFVWEIQIIGNNTVSDEAILERLSDLDFSLGSYIPSLDAKKLAVDYMTDSDQISWIGINIIGTCVEVHIREVETEVSLSDNSPSNLVAARDGLVEWVELYSGQNLVEAGSSVRAGQVLVSGFYEGRTEGVYRMEASLGRVMARTTRDFTLTVPIQKKKKSFTGNIFTVKSFLFFGHEFSILKSKEQLPYENYDESTTIQSITLAGHTIPIGIKTISYQETTILDYTQTEEEARSEANRKMADLISQELPGAEILSISKSESNDGATYRLEWLIYCLENIAIRVPLLSEDTIQ